MISPDSTLKCIGNTFADNETHPIVMHSHQPSSVYETVDPSDIRVLRDNIIKGNNHLNGQEFHENVVYQVRGN